MKLIFGHTINTKHYNNTLSAADRFTNGKTKSL